MMMPRARRSSRKAGFTIIEMLIAMTILSFIALGVYEITTSTFSRRESIEQEGDFYNSIRVALDVVGRDVSQIYSPMPDALPGDLGKALRPPGASGQSGASLQQQQGAGAYGAQNQMPLGQPTDFWGEPINKEGVRPSRFQGEETKLSFVSSSHMRIYKDSPESELSKITYSLEEPKVPEPGVKGKVLVKFEDTDVFEDEQRSKSKDEETAVSFSLLTGVKSLSFEYLDAEKDTWSKRWDTSGMDHKGVYPAVIKITIEVYMPNSENTFVVTQQWRPELPI